MTKGMTLVCKLNGYVLGFAGMCLLAPPLLADEPDPDPITTVFLVCDGQFTVDSDWLPDVPPDSFDGTIYLSVTRNGDVFTQIKLQPFERKERLRSQTFVPNVVLQDVSAEQTPAATDDQFGTAETTHIVTISASNDEAHLAGRDWIVGDDVTIADMTCCGYLYYPEPFGFDRADWPNIDAWLTRLSQQPGWKAPYDLMPGNPSERA